MVFSDNCFGFLAENVTVLVHTHLILLFMATAESQTKYGTEYTERQTETVGNWLESSVEHLDA